MIPATFIASTSEAKEIKDAVETDLANRRGLTRIKAWDNAVFSLSGIIIEGLSEKLKECDFAIIIMSADDFIEIRGEGYYTVRDNVTLELGMAIGALGRERCFILRPSGIEKLRIPSDLAGIVLGEYLDINITENAEYTAREAVNNVCTLITERINELGIRKRVIHESLIKENISYVSHNREHSSGSKRYWYDAKKSVDILAPTFFNTIRGLTESSRLPKHLEILNNEEIRVRLALLNPDSSALPLHNDFLNVAAEGGLSKNYKKQVLVFMRLMSNENFEIRFYDFYPTTSYVIVDDKKCKVDILLPHAGIESRPTIEAQNGSDEDQNFFSSVAQNFSDIWVNTKEIIA